MTSAEPTPITLTWAEYIAVIHQTAYRTTNAPLAQESRPMTEHQAVEPTLTTLVAAVVELYYDSELMYATPTKVENAIKALAYRREEIDERERLERAVIEAWAVYEQTPGGIPERGWNYVKAQQAFQALLAYVLKLEPTIPTMFNYKDGARTAHAESEDR